MNGSDTATARAITAGVRDFFDLVMHNSLLELCKQHLAVLEFEPQIAMTLAGQTETLKLLRPLLSCLSSRFHDNPNVHVSPL